MQHIPHQVVQRLGGFPAPGSPRFCLGYLVSTPQATIQRERSEIPVAACFYLANLTPGP